ncbi:MAG TPA: OsmC family protein [Saprospiraceae bacterium]|mgnify:CR=1 FL=1|jgi:putative redox protein|nr:OsmC family protein [Saprospiraceae bacterium]HRO07693.1 OsmC family protein [Saprospiraceae bacterium]HRO72310.1 OsmC family protein [Saprospiraceae bacterium]HRP41082.1 OsmC family protein [Saprospiraceae bacterium]
MENHHVSAHIRTIKYKTEITAGNHKLTADESITDGGGDAGPNPGQLLASSLAACSSITMRMYADRKGWPLEEIIVHVDFDRNIATNSTVFTKKITLTGNLDDVQKKRLYEIADKCPIHRVLTGTISIDTETL